MPAAFNPDEWIYHVEDLTFTVDDEEYPVSRVVFTAFDNKFPTVTLRIAAVDSVDTDIQAITVAQLIEYQNKLQQKAGVDGVETLLKFKLVSPKDTQELELENWSLHSAGLEPVGSSGDVAATIMLAHPAILATKASLILYNFANAVEQPASIDGGNIYENFLKAAKVYLEEVENGGSNPPGDNYDIVGNQSIDELNEITLERVAKSLEDLEKSVEWGGDEFFSYPYKDINFDIAELLKPAIWNSAQMQGSDPFSAMSQLLGDFLLVFSGTFNNDKLQIIPYAPWGKSVGFITDDEVTSITLPSTDPGLISGVLCRFECGKYTEWGYLPPGYIDNVKGGSDLQPEDNTQVAGFIKHAKQLLGPIVDISLPGWLSSIFKRESNTGFTYDEKKINPDNDTVDTSAAAADYQVLSQEIYDIASTYAEDVFYQMYRSQMQIAFNTRFMMSNPNIKTPDNLLRPGVTMHLQSIEDDKPLLYFYVNRVEHIIDAHEGSAYSRFTGGYVRPAEGIKGADDWVITEDQVKEGIPNRSYSGTGEIDAGIN